MAVEFRDDLPKLDWKSLAGLYVVYGDTPLSHRDPGKLERAFRKSFKTCIALDGGNVIGAGRVVSDGEYYAKIHDVVVEPRYQGEGIGTAILKRLLVGLDDMFVLLTTDIGKENFYRKLGFKRHKAAMARYPKGAHVDADLLLE